MSQPRAPDRQEYLDRLRDLLPARESRRVVAEVEAMILDRVEVAERDGGSPAEAEARALTALGPPETLADRLAAHPVRIDLATRRSFLRWLLVLFAGHLTLSIVLTAAGAEEAPVQGLLGPLPTQPWLAFVAGVLAVFLVDLGAVFAAFVLLAGRHPLHGLPFPRLRPVWHRGDSVLALVALAVVVAVINAPLREVLFALRHAGKSTPILAEDLVALVPFANAILALVALRHVVLVGRGTLGRVDVVLDMVATAGTIALLVAAILRRDYVRLPETVDPHLAAVLQDLATRGLLLGFVLAAFFLAIRLVRRGMLLRQVA